DGVELHGRPARRANSSLHMRRELAQVVVARHGFDPRIGHPDDRLFQVLISEADGLKHGSRRRAVASLGNRVALKFHGNFHRTSSYEKYIRRAAVSFGSRIRLN